VDGNPVTSSYLSGSGDSRIPVEVYADAPYRRPDDECADLYGRRPVIAVLDSGVRAHPWLGVEPVPGGYKTSPDGSVEVSQSIQDAIYAHARDALTAGDLARKLIKDPWDTPVTADPLVGEVDTDLGHGTFISGIFRQAVPDATVLSIRIMHSDGIVYEGDLTYALGLVAAQVRQAQNPADPDPGLMIDAVSLSLGYFCESPADVTYTSGLKATIDTLLDMGVMVVAAAGNYATSRLFYPAAFAAAHRPPGALPLVSVGALNPNETRALFSDGGRWVTAWASGAMVVSTFPIDVNGSLDPAVEVRGRPGPDGRRNRLQTRESLDPDDFRGGFAAWNGTSFAAPALAAWVIEALLADAEYAAEPKLANIAKDAEISRALHALRRRDWQG
jgi:hypothetical protein